MKNVLKIFILFAIAGCQPNQSYDYNYQPRPMFRTTPPARLYFKNMRSTYYDQIAAPSDTQDLYLLRRYPSSSNRPILQAAIADNWMRDEAYLQLTLQWPAAYSRDTFRLQWKTKKESGFIDVNKNSWASQLNGAREVESALRSHYRFYWTSDEGQLHELLRERTERQAFLTTLRDFQKLTGQE